jgi:hypothetical protein
MMYKMRAINLKVTVCAIVITMVAVIFYSCRKTVTQIRNQPPEMTVAASITGQITDLNNNPIDNASVFAGVDSTTTDSNGVFTIKNAQLNQDAGLVKIIKPGYFEGARTFLVHANVTNNVRVQLIPKAISGSFDAATGGYINVSGGGSVNFLGGFVDAASAIAYTGEVSVATFYLNPADSNFSKLMPGDLRGINTSNQQSILKAYGMAVVEMDDASGAKLQLAPGKTATISLPIPSTIRVGAPATVPLWYFDPTTGFWRQQGTATRQGDSYVGTVSHFSFWVAGQLGASVKLSASFTMDTSNVPFANKLVTLTRPDSTTSNGYTDSTGTITGLVPAGEVLAMKVFNDCGEAVYARNIGPFSGDTVLGNISVENGACYSTDSTQYINLSIGADNYYWPSTHISEGYMTGSYTIIVGGSPQDTSNISTFFEGIIFGGETSPGSYPISLYTILNGNITYQAGGQAYDSSYAYPITTVTKYDTIGGYIEGTFTGSINALAVSGNYRVKRVQ